MPIPFLVYGLGAAAAAAAAAIAVKVFSDDDEPSGSGRSSDDDDAERRRTKEAEKERKKRERAEKREAAFEDFQKQGRAFGKSVTQTLPADLVRAYLPDSAILEFDLKNGSLTFNPEEAIQRDQQLLIAVSTLRKILTKRTSHQRTTENLMTFSELYKPKFHCGVDLEKEEKRMERLDRDIEDLTTLRHQLMKLESELHSART